MDEKVISKIRKMLAIANDNGATEGERDNAMRMVHNYMVKHNLAMSQIEVKTEERILDKHKFYGNRWSRSIMMSVSELFFCHYSFIKGGGGRGADYNLFVGLESNVVTVKELSVFVIKSIEKAARELKKGGYSSKFILAFCYGASFKIHERCGELKKKSIEQSEEPGTGIVLASYYDQEKFNNDKFNEDHGRKMSEGKQNKTRLNIAGTLMGQEFGKSISLNTQIGEKK